MRASIEKVYMGRVVGERPKFPQGQLSNCQQAPRGMPGPPRIASPLTVGLKGERWRRRKAQIPARIANPLSAGLKGGARVPKDS